ncbi:MAG: hypothetical protein PUB07_03015 [Clostridia bacterium]|nr:hypothetical protein [Clostridia bacterium]
MKKNLNMQVPQHIRNVCDVLENAGYSAYIVGGSVRDMLLGVPPADYDIATAAKPDMIKSLFCETVSTGEKHGTIGVLSCGTMVEVTTFRADGTYTDHRRPDTVHFLDDISADLARRDFTINAMAYHLQHGLLDLYGGRDDIKNRILRTVGVPKERFTEDALRILRLFRFAARLNFDIEAESLQAAISLADSLRNVAKERVFTELRETVLHVLPSLLKRMEPIFAFVLPEALPLTDTKCALAAKCQAEAGKWAILCGDKTESALSRLSAPKRLRLAAKEFADYTPGRNLLLDIAKLKYNTPDAFAAFQGREDIPRIYEETRKAGLPVSPSELALSGKELYAMGFRGEQIGALLDKLFLYVTENSVNNNEEDLKEAIKKICKK